MKFRPQKSRRIDHVLAAFRNHAFALSAISLSALGGLGLQIGQSLVVDLPGIGKAIIALVAVVFLSLVGYFTISLALRNIRNSGAAEVNREFQEKGEAIRTTFAIAIVSILAGLLTPSLDLCVAEQGNCPQWLIGSWQLIKFTFVGVLAVVLIYWLIPKIPFAGLTAVSPERTEPSAFLSHVSGREFVPGIVMAQSFPFPDWMLESDPQNLRPQIPAALATALTSGNLLEDNRVDRRQTFEHILEGAGTTPVHRSPWLFAWSFLQQHFWKSNKPVCLFIVQSTTLQLHFDSYLGLLTHGAGPVWIIPHDREPFCIDGGERSTNRPNNLKRCIFFLQPTTMAEMQDVQRALEPVEDLQAKAEDLFQERIRLIYDMTFGTAVYSATVPALAFNRKSRAVSYIRPENQRITWNLYRYKGDQVPLSF